MPPILPEPRTLNTPIPPRVRQSRHWMPVDTSRATMPCSRCRRPQWTTASGRSGYAPSRDSSDDRATSVPRAATAANCPRTTTEGGRRRAARCGRGRPWRKHAQGRTGPSRRGEHAVADRVCGGVPHRGRRRWGRVAHDGYVGVVPRVSRSTISSNCIICIRRSSGPASSRSSRRRSSSSVPPV